MISPPFPVDLLILVADKDMEQTVVGICARAEALEKKAQEEEQKRLEAEAAATQAKACLLYTSPSPRDRTTYRMPSSACKKKIKQRTQDRGRAKEHSIE